MEILKKKIAQKKIAPRIIDQLTALKNWSQGKPYKKVNAYSEPLTKSGLKWNKVTGKVEDNNGDIVSMRDTLTEMQYEDLPTEAELKKEKAPPKKKIKVAGIKDTALYKTLKDPRVIGLDLGSDTIREIINLIQNSGLVKKPKPEPTISIEEEINQIAHKRKLAENKLFGLNEEFAKQKLRERMS